MSDADIRASDGAADDVTVNPGELLAQAREKAKLSTADVARQLKLSVAQVEALEAGQFERLPGSVFVRGFIRNYARLVKIDPDHLLAAAGDRLPRPVARPEAPPSPNIPFPSTTLRRWPRYAWAAAVILVALAGYEFLVSSEDAVVTTRPVEVSQAPEPAPAQATSPALQSTGAAPKPEIAAPKPTSAVTKPSTGSSAPAAGAEKPNPSKKMVSSAATGDTRSVAKEPAPVKGMNLAPAVEPAKTSASAPDSPAQLPKVVASSPQTNPDEKQATLVFEDESWVEVRDRIGKVIHWQLNPAGTRQIIRGTPPMSFVIGNAHGVRLTYDQRPVDLAPYTSTDVARMTLK